jgi:hypothetical protein
MAVRREYVNPDNDIGKWHVWKIDPDNGKPIRARLRQIPQGIENKIRSAHKSESLRVHVNKSNEEGSMDVDLVRNRKIARDRAAFALLETENYNVGIGDDDAAALWSKLSESVVEKGKELVLDDKWHLGALKGHELTENPEFAGWCISIIDGDAAELAERNAELEGNS